MLDLNKGLLLENSKVFIPWGIKKDKAWSLGSPSEWNDGDDSRITWKNVSVFNGIHADILVWFPKKSSVLKSITIMPPRKERKKISDRKWPVKIAEHLSKEIGLPIDYEARKKKIEKEIGIPMFTWRTGKVKLSQVCDVRFTEGFWLQVSIEP